MIRLVLRISGMFGASCLIGYVMLSNESAKPGLTLLCILAFLWAALSRSGDVHRE